MTAPTATLKAAAKLIADKEKQPEDEKTIDFLLFFSHRYIYFFVSGTSKTLKKTKLHLYSSEKSTNVLRGKSRPLHSIATV